MEWLSGASRVSAGPCVHKMDIQCLCGELNDEALAKLELNNHPLKLVG